MGINPDALYLNLLEDLSEYLTYDQYQNLLNTRKCEWYPDSSVNNVRAVQLANSFLKKFKGKTSQEADEVCLQKFTEVNDQCGRWKLDVRDELDYWLICELKYAIYQFLNPRGYFLVPGFHSILEYGNVGPGASRLSLGDDFYSKLFAGRLSTTNGALYGIYANYFEGYPEWHSAERFREQRYGDFDLVEGNRMSFVPKNVDTSRLICTEPSLNMFFQLGLGRLLERRLSQFFGIDFATQQEINKDLARIGSEDHKGNGLVTIDLSSASDSLSLAMVEEVLPVELLDLLKLFRSPYSEMPNGALLQLNMISTMGNGYTFPLQTMLFACVVLAASKVYNSPLRRSKPEQLGNFGVFGDDIICEQETARGVIRLLELLGFQVNHEKSFLKGPFRESCGGDFFRGHPVRGVYCKSLERPQHRYAVINQLNLWSARSGLPVRKTVRHLQSSVKDYFVPIWENEDAGIRCTYSCLSTKRRSKRYQSLVYKRWRARPKRMRIMDGVIHVPKGQKPRVYNPYGLMLAFLRGDIAHGKISVRQRTVDYTLTTGVAPNWDTLPAGVALQEKLFIPSCLFWRLEGDEIADLLGIPVSGSVQVTDISLSNFGWAVAANCRSPR